ncbi:hypothetical protein [Aquabacterium sp.]|uniref:hypothetical protein n=1 Tax=Aquabacterium sp. TaxID=1872578 RepID=UPI0024894F70|nr:hypothetical protein [Aquabacterium sp.]MDI1258209.1 hypothetical protein [Aquabacterium sp.]
MIKSLSATQLLTNLKALWPTFEDKNALVGLSESQMWRNAPRLEMKPGNPEWWRCRGVLRLVSRPKNGAGGADYSAHQEVTARAKISTLVLQHVAAWSSS